MCFPLQRVSFTWLKRVSLPQQEFCFFSMECKRMVIAKRAVMGLNGCKDL